MFLFVKPQVTLRQEDNMTVTDDKVLTEIDWFNGQLLHLKDTFIAWLKEEGHDVDVSENALTGSRASPQRSSRTTSGVPQVIE
jgi:hypothetical protein